jgi:hypothetical protein
MAGATTRARIRCTNLLPRFLYFDPAPRDEAVRRSPNRQASFFFAVPKILEQVFLPFLVVGFRPNRQQNLADLRDAPRFPISDLLEAFLEVAWNSKCQGSNSASDFWECATRLHIPSAAGACCPVRSAQASKQSHGVCAIMLHKFGPATHQETSRKGSCTREGLCIVRALPMVDYFRLLFATCQALSCRGSGAV